MMMPSLFRENLLDEFVNDPFESLFAWGRNPIFGKREGSLLKTDVKENDGNYELDMDLPGFKKEDVVAKLEDGYLTISATRDANKEEKDKDGNYIRRERYSGKCQRTFYVGTHLKQEDIKARFEDGIWHLIIPKAETKVAIEDNKYIPIEG